MASRNNSCLHIQNAHTNNLKGVSLDIPHHQFIVVTGVSGSGKSSLAFDIIAREGQRRYFETLPAFSRQFLGKLSPVDADYISGLSPVIAVQQKTGGTNARSTVGTLTDIYSWLRLLYARAGSLPKDDSGILNETKLTRSLFSFNSDQGKCLTCNGLGKSEKIDLKKLVQHPEKTIREGALAPTLPNGYIMYSQVTIDALNQVCEAHGFNVDIRWNALTDEQKHVILHGSEKVKVPFGKHSIESRLKWTGIKANPREEGYYRGMIPIMSEILRRDRNPSILKYVTAVTCSTCKGKRLNETALSVKVKDKDIAELLELSLEELRHWIHTQKWNDPAAAIVEKIIEKIDLLDEMGLTYLCLNESAKSLSESEIQRVRVVNQLGTDLSEVLYIFDEPSIGLSRSENAAMIRILRRLVNKGNTVIVVEHDLEIISQADWIVDVGPGAGTAGGNIQFNGRMVDFLVDKELAKSSATRQAIKAWQSSSKQKRKTLEKRHAIVLSDCREGKLNGGDFHFPFGKFTTVTGKSGSGKSDLVKKTLKQLVENHLKDQQHKVEVTKHLNIECIDRLVFADQSPIGRTPRSNPATYLKIADRIRDLFATLPESKANGLTKSHFSFNTKGGRCETCQGAGKIQIGMHFLGKVDLICEACDGKRFKPESLAVSYKGRTISDLYSLTVNEAFVFFDGEKKLQHSLGVLQKIGLGYLTLGQASNTLSGGEAQRIKLAKELQKKATGNTLYILDQPSIGLHPTDLEKLIELFEELTASGNTLVCIEQDDLMLNEADHVINLSPINSEKERRVKPETTDQDIRTHISLKGVSTHLLKNVNVRFPKNQLTVVTGLSGSGKSSLVYDSLYAEASNRFSESLSIYGRSLIQSQNKAVLESAQGLTPTVALQRKRTPINNGSTVATLTGIHDHLRLLYSRIAQLDGYDYTAQHFSFNHKLGACPKCTGQGIEKKCDPQAIIIDPNLPLFSGALTQQKAARYFTNITGQFVAILNEIFLQKNWDSSLPWKDLSNEIQTAVLYGTGNQEWETNWTFETKTRSGNQQIKAKWLGFCNYIDDEYQRRANNKNIAGLLELLQDRPCSTCNGNRLKDNLLEVKFRDKNIAEICQLSVSNCHALLQKNESREDLKAILNLVSPPITALLTTILDLGLGYLTLDRVVHSLSGGEQQRVKLAGQLAANLHGVTYVLDEPSIGLDEQQCKTLLKLIRNLIEKGNTAVVIEHDRGVIEAADYIVEMGPASGEHGGEICFQGSKNKLKQYPNSLTQKLLSDPVKFKPVSAEKNSTIFGVEKATANNLKNINVNFHTNRITAVTGVSGSGKTSLIRDVIYNSIKRKRTIGCKAIFGFEAFHGVHFIDQSPVALNTLSSPASYLGILAKLQRLFAKAPNAHGLKAADFSYLSKKGKCPDCQGYGEVKTAMDFTGDLWLPCETCKGNRYHPTINLVKLTGTDQNAYCIGDFLQLTIDQVEGLLVDKTLNLELVALQNLGLGHLKLGQAGNTLSGGEAQRLKLAYFLKEQKGPTLFMIDEPGTGLHEQDLVQLINTFNELIEQGHTVLFIEHHAALVSVAHHVVKLGPASGDGGGSLI